MDGAELRAAWRELAVRFAEIRSIDHDKFYASWIAGQGWHIGGIDDDHARDVFMSAVKRAAALLKKRPDDFLSFWLEMLRTESSHFQGGTHIGYGTETSLGESEEIGTIRDLCLASAEHCYKLETRTIVKRRTPKRKRRTPKKSRPRDARAQGPGTRENRLQAFLTNNTTTVAAVCREANVYKTNMQQWRRGELSDTSVMSQRIESILKG